LTETNKCGNCGAIVPAEKAFCPNCSEPMEAEETPDRADSMSSEMMSTIRDDPESYKELLDRLKKDRAAARQNASGPTQATPPAPQPAAYDYPPAAPGYAAQNYPAPDYPAPPAKGGKRFVVLGVVAAVVLIIILLFAFKVIPL